MNDFRKSLPQCMELKKVLRIISLKIGQFFAKSSLKSEKMVNFFQVQKVICVTKILDTQIFKMTSHS